MAFIRRTVVPMLLTLSLTGCFARTPTEPIAIALLAPLTGPDQTRGEQAKQGTLLAVEEVNEEKNRIGNRQVEVRLVNTVGEAEAFQDQAVRLVTVNKVTALLGGNETAQAERMARAVQPNGVPVITLAALPAPVSGDNLFAIDMAPGYQGQLLARFALEELKITGVAVLSDRRCEVCTALATAFAKEYKANSIRLEQTYQSADDFPGLVERVQRAQPKAILIAGTAAEFIKLRGLLRGAGVEVPLLFGGDEVQGMVLQADQEASRGVYRATAYWAPSTTSENEKFVKRYRERFQQGEPDVFAALAYDGAMLLFAAMRRAKSNKSTVREELTKFNSSTEAFNSLTGKLFFDKNHGTRRTVFVLEVQDSRPAMRKAYEP